MHPLNGDSKERKTPRGFVLSCLGHLYGPQTQFFRNWVAKKEESPCGYYTFLAKLHRTPQWVPNRSTSMGSDPNFEKNWVAIKEANPFGYYTSFC